MWPLNVVAAAGGNLRHYTVIAGSQGGRVGFDSGAVNIGFPIGSINNTDFSHSGDFRLIVGLWTQGTGDFRFYLQPTLLADADSVFSQIDLTGTFVEGASTRVLTRSSRDAFNDNDAGETSWFWTTISPMNMINGNSYQMIVRWRV